MTTSVASYSTAEGFLASWNNMLDIFKTKSASSNQTSRNIFNEFEILIVTVKFNCEHLYSNRVFLGPFCDHMTYKFKHKIKFVTKKWIVATKIKCLRNNHCTENADKWIKGTATVAIIAIHHRRSAAQWSLDFLSSGREMGLSSFTIVIGFTSILVPVKVINRIFDLSSLSWK